MEAGINYSQTHDIQTIPDNLGRESVQKVFVFVNALDMLAQKTVQMVAQSAKTTVQAAGTSGSGANTYNKGFDTDTPVSSGQNTAGVNAGTTGTDVNTTGVNNNAGANAETTGVQNTDLVDAYNAGRNGEDLSRTTRENAAASNTLDQVEQMYKAGQADAKTGSASAETSQSLDGVPRPAETSNGVQTTETAETSPSTEQPGTDTTQKSGNEVNPELEAKLAPFEYTAEQRAVAEKYAETGDANVIPDSYGKETVDKIIQGAEVIKEFNAENGIDSQNAGDYNRAKNTEDTDVKNLRFDSWNDFSQYAQNIGKNASLSLEEKVLRIQQAFERIADQTDINIPIDAKYLIGFSKEGEVIYDWPLYLGFDIEKKIDPITRKNMLPETADRYGPMTGSNFSDIPKEGKYTRNQRSTPYVVNEKAYHVVNFNNETYFDKIDAIRAGDMNALNEILESEGISPVSEYFFDRLKQKYNDFIKKVARELGASVDATYGLKGTVAAWKDLKGGAGQIITPITGKMLIDLGIII